MVSERELAQRIREEIRLAGYTQNDIAAEIGMDPASLSRVVCGYRRLTAIEFALICEALDADPAEMLDMAPIE